MMSTRTRRSLLTLMALGGLSGCADNRVVGEVAGARLEVRDAVFYTDSQDPLVPPRTLLVVLSDTPELCNQRAIAGPLRNETALSITLRRCDERLKYPVGVGTYDGAHCLDHTPSTTNVADVTWRQFDAEGKETRHYETPSAAPPVIELESFQPGPGGRARGSFRAVLGEGGFPVHGAFNATWCEIAMGAPIRRPAAPPAPSSPPAPVVRQEPGSGPPSKPARMPITK